MKVRTRKPKGIQVEVDGIKITGTNLSLKERSEIEENNTFYRSGVPVVDRYESGFEMFNKRILAWSPNPKNEDGEELECNTGNKRLVWEFDQQWCGDILVELNSAIEKRKDLAEKN